VTDAAYLEQTGIAKPELPSRNCQTGIAR